MGKDPIEVAGEYNRRLKDDPDFLEQEWREMLAARDRQREEEIQEGVRGSIFHDGLTVANYNDQNNPGHCPL